MTIRTDATRLRITPRDQRPMRAVAPRQGQVLLDADLQQDGQMTLARIDGDMADVIGAPGRFAFPSSTPAFAVQIGGGGPMNLTIQHGHGFLDGWRVDNQADCTLTTQPHPRTDPAPALPTVVAIKALVRHIDPVEDPAFADKALGDAQATGRLLVDWQVFPQALSGTASCATVLSNDDWQRLSAPSTGTLEVSVQASGPGTDPCSLLPRGGYSRQENLLYRLEVHGGDSIPTPGNPPALADGPRLRLEGLKLKLSRRNASLLVAITGINGTEINVSPPATDPRAWFAPGSWAEIVHPGDDVDPRAALASERLFRVAQATDDRVTLEATVTALNNTGATGNGGWYLRLWDALPDGSGVLVLGAPDGQGMTVKVPLGDGLLVSGGGGARATFRRGDYWTFAARADGTIDWDTPQQPPHGPTIRYAPLAIISGSPTAPTLQDCRLPFARLIDRVLHYRGGDGQSTYAGAGGDVTLIGLLRLAVLRGATPVAGAIVEWSLPPGAASSKIGTAPVTATQRPTSTTNDQGEIEVAWTLNGNAPDGPHVVRAALLGDGSGQPVIFSARFDKADTTSYNPGNCRFLAGTVNVQDAIDGLCRRIDNEPTSLRLAGINLINSSKSVTRLIQGNLILNGLEVPFDAFLQGIEIRLETKGSLNFNSAPFDPIIEVELDLPYPCTDLDRLYWMLASQIKAPCGFQRLRLDGEVRPSGSDNSALLWQPGPMAEVFLANAPDHLFGSRRTRLFKNLVRELGPEVDWADEWPKRILVRLRVCSAHVWIMDATTQKRVYLNAEHLGVSDKETGRELRLSDRDLQRAADLDMFFYLLMPRPL